LKEVNVMMNSLLLGDVLRRDRALVLGHGGLFVTEVRARVLANLIEQPGDLRPALALAHGSQQVVQPDDELLVLVIDRVDAGGHGLIPGNGSHEWSPVSDGRSIGRDDGRME
jgi:hypothetical protein